MVQALELLRPRCGTDEERTYRLTRLLLIAQYLAEHLSDFDVGDFAVVGSDEAGALVREHLLRAVHDIFTTRSLSQLGHGPSPEEVLCLAASFRDESSGPVDEGA